MQSFLPLLGGIGLGMLFHAPYQALTGALSPKELAAGTSVFFLVRFTGATVGLARINQISCISFELTCRRAQSIAGAIYEGGVSRNLLQGSSLASQSVSTNVHHQDVVIAVGAIRVCVVFLDAARFLSILKSTSHTQDIWTMCAPCLGSALLVRCTPVMLRGQNPMSSSRSQLSLFLRPTPLPSSEKSAGANTGADAKQLFKESA